MPSAQRRRTMRVQVAPHSRPRPRRPHQALRSTTATHRSRLCRCGHSAAWGGGQRGEGGDRETVPWRAQAWPKDLHSWGCPAWTHPSLPMRSAKRRSYDHDPWSLDARPAAGAWFSGAHGGTRYSFFLAIWPVCRSPMRACSLPSTRGGVAPSGCCHNGPIAECHQHQHRSAGVLIVFRMVYSGRKAGV